ncbi:hypothetical protein Tco_0393295 [Tanacetum coccineum]
MANLPPNHNEFAPAAEAAPDNMNGWVEEEDPEMEEEEEDPEEDPEMEEEEEEMEMNADEEWDGPDFEEGEAEALRLRRGLGSSSSSAAVGHNPKDPTPSHIRSDLDALHRRVRQIENDDMRAENKRLRMMRWSIAVENLLPPRLQYQKPPYALPKALLTPVIHVMLQCSLISDMMIHYQQEGFTIGAKGSHLCEERQRKCRGQGNNANEAGGQGGAPAARECTFSGFMKCNPTVFHGHEGAVELSRWFEKMEMVARKVKFAAATLQGRALTWWNSQVATMGLEAANQIGCD